MADLVLVTREDSIAIVQLNRPEALNALSVAMLDKLGDVLGQLDADEGVRCIVITGSEKAFAAGADVKEFFEGGTPTSIFLGDVPGRWERLREIKTPLVAAVSGYALGGGCELAMLCDVIVASETAQFGQPEINFGFIPGAGGTQRLVRAVGKYVANDLILTARFIKADEARAIGLVSRVFPIASWLEDAKEVARTIASKAPIAARLVTELVDEAQSTPLDAGLQHERKAFAMLFATEDQKEGLDAFVNKRKPAFKGR